jgi:hypothetical protein
MVCDREDVEEVLAPVRASTHGGIEVEDRESYVAKIKANGGTAWGRYHS